MIVFMKCLLNFEVNSYLVSGDWCGKVGGYVIQGFVGVFILWINGFFIGVVGLFLVEIVNLLILVGYFLYGVLK